MSKNEFDELLLKKLREEELEYDPASWDRLSQLLPPTLTPQVNKGRKWLLATGIAAALAFTLATVLFVKLMRSEKDAREQISLAAGQQQQTEPGTVQTPQNTGTKAGIAPAASLGNTGQKTAYLSPAKEAKVPQPVLPLFPALGEPREPNRLPMEDIALVPEPAKIPVPGTEKQEQETAPVRKEEQYAAALKNSNTDIAPSAFYEGKFPGNHNSNRTSIGVGGGMSYGNMNAGYAVGISARTKIAGDFFVDGTVAMLYNNNTINTSVNNGPSMGDNNSLASRPAEFANTAASPALSPIQKLYYVQFNPSLGYQVEQHIALSVGGDFQQMLNRNEEVVLQSANNAKILPNFDVGLTTKSEFSITPNIQAGLLYREGLNNLFKNEGSRYVNRRYIQVQFKYNLPVN